MLTPASNSPHEPLLPRVTLLVTQRPRPGLGRLLPTLEALGAPAMTLLATQIGDTLPPPFHLAPQQVVVLATDPPSAAAAWRAGAGLVAGLGSGNQAVAQLAAGAELVLRAPSEIGSGSLLQAYADKFRRLPQAELSASHDAALALFLNLDHLLLPASARPTANRLPSPWHDLLPALAARYPTAVISQRSLRELAACLPEPSVYLAGNHGLQLSGPAYAPASLDATFGWRPVLDAACERLLRLEESFPGCQVIHKDAALSLDLGDLAPAAAVQLRRAVVRTLAGFEGLQVDGDRRRLEIRPALNWDAGTAVDWLLAQMRRAVGPCRAVYLGRCAYDEPAFRAMRRVDGLGVLLDADGRATAASRRLDSVALAAMLETLLR